MQNPRRLLVVADAAVAQLDELPTDVRALVATADDVFVVTPTLPTRLEWIASDTDRARHAADERLDAVLGHLWSAQVPARGAVGDDTPFQAIADHVRAFHPDRILLALRTETHADWQERGLVEAVTQEFELPVTVFEIERGGRADDRSAHG